ncbi:MAG: hypothetical protein ACKVX7_13400 [Planctomycetota bacterium]
MLTLSSVFLPGGDSAYEARIARLLSFSVEAYEIAHPLGVRELEELANTFRSQRRQALAIRSDVLQSERELAFPALAGPRASIAATDESERRTAVETARGAVDWAARLEARACVVDGGTLAVTVDESTARARYDAGTWRASEGQLSNFASDALRRLGIERPPLAARAMDACKRSMDTLLVRCDQQGLELAVENSGSMHGFLQLAEMEELARTFRGSKLVCWFDPSRARVLSLLGLAKENAELEVETVFDTSAGAVIVQDTRGIQYDLPPGEGEWPLDHVYKRHCDHRPLVLRVGDTRIDDQRLAAAIEFLRSRGLNGPAPIEAEPFPIFGRNTKRQ